MSSRTLFQSLFVIASALLIGSPAPSYAQPAPTQIHEHRPNPAPEPWQPPDPMSRLEELIGMLAQQPTDIPDGYVLLGCIQMPIERFLGLDAATFGPGPYWPRNPVSGRYEIPVVFDRAQFAPTPPNPPFTPNPGYVSDANRDAFRGAMGEVQAVANISFVELAVSPPGPHVFVRNSTGNNSPVGMQFLNVINIVSWGSRWIIVHELMHTLGFWHEQSRADRNQFITVNINNVLADQRHNYDIEPSSSTLGEYDFGSLMHYGQCDFTSCSPCSATCRSIDVQPAFAAQWQNMIGQRSGFSNRDREMISYLYPFNDWRFANASAASNGSGTFVDPYRETIFSFNGTPETGTLNFLPGYYPNSIGVFTRRMQVKAPVGGAVLGR